MSLTPAERRVRRRLKIRKRVYGTSERPRLAVYRSAKHLHAQVINDYQGKTIFSFSTTGGKFQTLSKKGASVDAARKLGELFGGELKNKGIQQIVFDRSGYKYHGRIKALADALRSSGGKF